MPKPKNRSFYKEESRYIDGYGIDSKKEKMENKSKNKRMDRALKIHNIEELMHLDDDFDEDEYYKE